MELIIKILFILALFVFNVNIFSPLMKMTDSVNQKVAFMLLAGFNIFATTGMLAILHPEILDHTGELLFSGCVGGGVIFIVSLFPFKS